MAEQSQLNIKKQIPKIRHQRNKTENIDISEKIMLKNTKNSIHERLYNEWIRKQFNNNQLKGKVQAEYEHSVNHSKNKYKNSKYLQNYIQFYERLESEVNKKNDKFKYYEQNPNFSLEK